MITLAGVTILTTDDAAKLLGIDAHQVRRIAKRKQVGQQISRSVWLFSLAEVNRMKA